MVLAFGIVACGSGGSSSGGMPGVSAVECLDLNLNIGSQPPSVTVANTCAFPINIATRQGDDSFGSITTLNSNEEIIVTVRPGDLIVGACRAPSTPFDASDNNSFQCSNI